MGAFVLLGGGLTWGFWKWTAPSCAPSAAASYLAKGPTNVVYVQWHQPSSSKTITGAISLVSLWGKPPAEHMSVESHHFTGQLLGCSGPGNISITMRINDLSLKDSLAGAFQDGKLVLHDESEPTLSGAIYIMVRSDPAAYNAAVRTLAAKRLRANKEALVRRA
jgi:hypothetical protein